MASPPYRSPATSPPHPPNIPLPNPKKRPSVNVPPYAPSLKRQKRSSIHSAASSAHPLRQTSFPPEESAIVTGERSPSVDSEITNITGKGGLAKVGGGRRRKSKGKAKQTAASVKSGAKEKTIDGREGTGEVPDDDDEDDDEGGDDVLDHAGEEDREAEEKKLAWVQLAIPVPLGKETDAWDAGSSLLHSTTSKHHDMRVYAGSD